MAGRKSKLTEAQWSEIARRRLNGETTRELATEFGVSAMAISLQTKNCKETIETVANQVVDAQVALKKLPVTLQKEVNQHVANLLALSAELGAAGIAGAKTARRISEAAQKRTEELSDAELLSETELRSTMQAHTASNVAAKQGMDLLNLAAKPGQAVEPEKDVTPTGIDLTAARAVAAKVLERLK